MGLISTLLILISACAPPIKVPVEERRVTTVRQQSEAMGGQLVRVVQPGNTLYGIAFEYNLDINQLAAWNDIADTSRLLVGQRIRLTEPIGYIAKSANRSNRITATVNRQSKASKRLVSTPKKSDHASSATQTNQAVVSTPNPKLAEDNQAKLVKLKVNDNANVRAWSWPIKGQVIRRFSPSSTQQGIDILAASGQAVRATAPGEVVYIGDSLKGYGNLIIVKHNETYLSAYAHNRKILVKEGQKITSSQIIGSVGINNRRESALHFQIRREGKPVNPLNYLSAM